MLWTSLDSVEVIWEVSQEYTLRDTATRRHRTQVAHETWLADGVREACYPSIQHFYVLKRAR